MQFGLVLPLLFFISSISGAFLVRRSFFVCELKVLVSKLTMYVCLWLKLGEAQLKSLLEQVSERTQKTTTVKVMALESVENCHC